MADFFGLMKQAAELKTKMEAMQAELDQLEVEGAAGGGMVRVRMTAKGELKAVTLDASLMKPDEKEVAEDLIVAAHGDARRKAEALMQEKMKNLTGGLPREGEKAALYARSWDRMVAMVKALRDAKVTTFCAPPTETSTPHSSWR